MTNYNCTEVRHCDGYEMMDGQNIYCTKHFLSESAYEQIADLNAQIREALAALHASEPWVNSLAMTKKAIRILEGKPPTPEEPAANE